MQPHLSRRKRRAHKNRWLHNFGSLSTEPGSPLSRRKRMILCTMDLCSKQCLWQYQCGCWRRSTGSWPLPKNHLDLCCTVAERILRTQKGLLCLLRSPSKSQHIVRYQNSIRVQVLDTSQSLALQKLFQLMRLLWLIRGQLFTSDLWIFYYILRYLNFY